MRPITARDLMNPDVLTVEDTMTVRELAAFLIENEISGAPVEDADGRLVGVVSLLDVAASTSGSLLGGFYGHGFDEEVDEPDLGELEGDEEGRTVADIMTPTLYTIDEHASVAEVASRMLDGHLHRLLVTGADPGTVVGIVSTSDLLGLLVDEK